MTLNELPAMADAALGGRTDVMRALRISRQRLSSAANGGPRLRAERLVQLGVVTGVEIAEALRAGGRAHLVAELAKGYAQCRRGV